MVFDSASLVAAQSQDPNIDENETFRGSYFGAPGQFQCIEAVGANPGCGIARNADGDIMVIDAVAATMGIQGGGRWTFTPDPDAMITVPDQDWMAYGAWLTTPDDAAGDHRLGVFFNGMDPYTPASGDGSLDATLAAGLRGKATYSGGATGVYVDGDRFRPVHRPRDADGQLRREQRRGWHRCWRLLGLRAHRQLPGHRWRVLGADTEATA